MNKNAKIVDGFLVSEIQAGSNKAFAVLVKRWHKRLCQQSYWYTRNREVAKDITQDCWAIIFNKVHRLNDTNSFGSWALKIVTRKSIDWCRKHRAERNRQSFYAIHSETNPAFDSAEISSTLSWMHKAIGRLSLRQQEVIRLFYLEELSVNQISEVLEIPKGTVKSRLFNAREKLKNEFKNKKL